MLQMDFQKENELLKRKLANVKENAKAEI